MEPPVDSSSESSQRPSLPRILRIVIGCAFGFMGISKLVGGHDPKFVMGPATYYGIGAFEVLLAAALLKGIAPRISIAACLVIVVGGAILSSFSPAPCGCLGRWVSLSKQAHNILSGCVGVLCLASLGNQPSQVR